MEYSLCLLVLVLCCLWQRSCQTTAGDDANQQEKTATISKFQFCEACKETVGFYAHLTANELSKMERAHKPANSQLDAAELTKYMCDNTYFNRFEPEIKYGCIKLINDYYDAFVKEFLGSFTTNSVTNKKEMYHRKRRICVKESKACSPEIFKRANVTNSARTRCKACSLVGDEIESLNKILSKNQQKPQFSKVKATDLKSLLGDGFCNNLGTVFQPYNWLEEVCEEMVDDYIDNIMGVMSFHKQILSTGMRPDESFSDMLCREIYKCKGPKRTEF